MKQRTVLFASFKVAVVSMIALIGTSVLVVNSVISSQASEFDWKLWSSWFGILVVFLVSKHVYEATEEKMLKEEKS